MKRDVREPVLVERSSRASFFFFAFFCAERQRIDLNVVLREARDGQAKRREMVEGKRRSREGGHSHYISASSFGRKSLAALAPPLLLLESVA